MRWIFEVAGFLALMGVIEGLVKPTIARKTRKATLKYVPALINFMDFMAPRWLAELSEDEIRQEMVQFLDGEGCPPEQQSAVISEADSEFSLLINAQKRSL